MFGRNAKKARAIFNAGLLKTFGKLSQPDIYKIDGRRERLIAELVAQYGWDEDYARRKVKTFDLKLSVGPETRVKELPACW